MVNAVFSSLPTYFMCTLKLPKTVIKQIDKFRRHCLWRGADINAKNHLKLLGKQSANQKLRGLGVINLELQNKALLMKCLHKFLIEPTFRGLTLFGLTITTILYL
jgi:hypothetical protein